MVGNSNSKYLTKFYSNYPEFSQQDRIRHSGKFHDFNFPILTFFAGKETSQSLRKILLLVLWDNLCRPLNDLVTQNSKPKKY